MIALDTNVVVRLLVRDDQDQAARAEALIRRATAAGDSLYIADVVLAELVWVLERSYKLPRDTILATLRRLRGARDVVFRSNEEFERAVEAYENGPGGFADYLIRETSRGAGCKVVYTFDGDLLEEQGYEAP